MQSDLDLLHAWQDGDSEAGNELVRRHFSSVYRFFRSKIDTGIDDLTQRTFLGCVEARDRFREETSFRAYLLGIARKQLLLYFRKRHRHGKVFTPAEVSIQQLGGDSQRSPTSAIAQREEQRLLLVAMRQIPVDFQIAVELYYWEQLPIVEIAQVLEIATGTVKSRLGRARAMLKDRIAELASSENLRRTTLDGFDRWAQSLRDAFPREEPNEPDE